MSSKGENVVNGFCVGIEVCEQYKIIAGKIFGGKYIPQYKQSKLNLAIC